MKYMAKIIKILLKWESKAKISLKYYCNYRYEPHQKQYEHSSK